jgi:hypothetical protein
MADGGRYDLTFAAAMLLVVFVSSVSEDTTTMLRNAAATRMRVRVGIVTVAPGASVPREQRTGRRCVHVPAVVVSDSTCATRFACAG